MMQILSNLSTTEVCVVAETCTHLKLSACEYFKFQQKLLRRHYYHIITTNRNVQDHQRILKNFGSVIERVRITGNISRSGLTNTNDFVFDWLERYCADTLQALWIDGSNDGVYEKKFVLPPSAVRLMSKLKILEISGSICYMKLRSALRKCTELVELSLSSNECRIRDISQCLLNARFPHLKKLTCELLNTKVDFRLLENFFKNHTKLTALRIKFEKVFKDNEGCIDLSFLKNLVALERLTLEMNSLNIVGIDALSHLHRMKEFSLAGMDVRTYSPILTSLASVDSMVKFTFVIRGSSFRDTAEIVRVLQCIKRFKNLSTLEVEAGPQRFSPYLDAKAIVDVIRNSTEIKMVRLLCIFVYSEEETMFFEDLAKVCLLQRRKIILLIKVCGADKRYLKFIEIFNQKHRTFVEIKLKEC